MHTLTKNSAHQDIALPVMGPHWEMFAPATLPEDEQVALLATRQALMQAEDVIRVQEERIRQLESLAVTDELTGLSNRRGFTHAFERELARARRDSGENGVLIMVDLDGFKAINDQYGHQAGDAYLCAVAKVLQDSVRSTDTVARLGGDEFGLVLAHTTEKHGAKRLAKLEQALRNRSMMWNGRPIALRASFGLACYTAADRPESVMRAADIRLYAHKARNKSPALYAAL
ncbi:MAG: GGDEF domain-containing protein [Alphaproteobacteria bacterium]|nr:GGDEF domain-containing protein [Alphaproteobacteria bacterium]